jgi:hypothetical protein
LPTATQKLKETHEIPSRKLSCDEDDDSDAAESSDQELPFQVRTRF